MKQSLTLASIALVLCTLQRVARADDGAEVAIDSPATAPKPARASSPGVVVALQPLGLLVDVIGVEVGVRVADELSLAFGARHTSYDLTSVEGSLWGASVGMHYFFGQAFRGYYLYPRVQLERAELMANTDHVQGYVLSSGVTAGHQWLLGPISVKLGLGARYVHASLSSGLTEANGVSSGIAPLADMDLGVAF
jgi:hypothetical protein